MTADDSLASPSSDPGRRDWPDEIRDALDGYATSRLILSWREVPGRGLVVIAADMTEVELRGRREADLFLAGLASAACAIHDGEARDA